jgi:MFS family permease
MFGGRWHWRNTALHSGVEAFWGLGLGFVGFQTVLPLFITRLGGGPVLVGALPALWALGLALPQLVVPILAAGRGRRKGIVTFLHFVAAAPWAGAALLFLLASGTSTGHLVAMLALFGAFCLSIGLTYPLWADYLARCTLPERRGGALGIVFLFQTVAGAAGAAVASLILGSRLPFPRGYGLCFLCAVVGMTAGNLFLLPTRERPSPARARPPLLGGIRATLSLAVGRGPFRRFLGARLLMEGWPLVMSFYTVLAARELEAGGETAARFTAVLLATQAVGNPILGRLGDRLGHTATLLLGHAAFLLGTGLLIVARGLPAFYAASALFGLFVAGHRVGHLNTTMAYAPREDTTQHLVASTLILAPFQAVAALLGGWAVQSLGFRPVWGIVMMLTLTGSLALLRIGDPKPQEPPLPGDPSMG